MNPVSEQIGRIRSQVAALTRDSVTYKLANVTAVDAVNDTFTAQIGDAEPLSGISAPPEFMPTVGQEVRLTLQGATPLYEPAQIAYLAPEKAVAGTITAQWIVAGGFLTALTGQRAGVTPIGFQAWNASNVLTVNLDGVSNLLTGKLQTAMSGRRIEIGAAGAIGSLKFFPTSGGAIGTLESYTNGGTEAIHMTLPITGTSSAWNGFQVQDNEQAYMSSGGLTMYFGGNGSGIKAFAANWVNDRSTFASVPRLNLTETDSNFYHPPFGDTFFIERQSDGTLHTKLWLGASGTYSSHNVGQSFLVQERQVGGTYQARFNLTQTDVWFQWPGTAGRMLVRPATASVSARLQFVNNASYGAVFRFNSNSDGTSQRMELTDATESGYAALWASAFTVSSSQTVKTGISDIGPGVLDTVKAMRVTRFRRKQSRDAEGQFGPEQRLEIGVIAEEAPAELRIEGGEFGPMVDHVGWTALNTAAIQELAAEVARLKAGKP